MIQSRKYFNRCSVLFLTYVSYSPIDEKCFVNFYAPVFGIAILYSPTFPVTIGPTTRLCSGEI